jgi:hypothetical protein
MSGPEAGVSAAIASSELFSGVELCPTATSASTISADPSVHITSGAPAPINGSKPENGPGAA